MAKIPTNSWSSLLQTSRVKTRRDPEPTLAFGFVLDYDCRLRWARYFLNECEKRKSADCKLTPGQFEERRSCLMMAINTTLPDHVYAALPDVPRLRRRLLPIEDGELVYNRWVFPLRDNSTTRNLLFPLTPEHIEAIRKELDLPDDQRPQWVPLPIF